MSERRDTALINIADYKHSTPIQIRFVDIDKMGRTNFFDDVIGQQDNWFERGLIIAHTDIDYYAPVYLRDEVNAYVRIVKTGTKSFGIEHLLVKTSNSKEETICAVATTVLVCMDYTKKQTIAIPAEWKEKLQAFEN